MLTRTRRSMLAALGALIAGAALNADRLQPGIRSGALGLPRARAAAAQVERDASSGTTAPRPRLRESAWRADFQPVSPASDAAAVDGLQADLEAYLHEQPGTYSVALRNLDTGQTVLINSSRQYLSASTYKVLIMYRVYEQFEAGRLSPGGLLTITERDASEGDAAGWLQPGETLTLRQALEALITVSSNNAAHALTRLVGGWGTVAAVAGELGMTGTTLRGGYFRTTPRDMLTFFEALSRGELVSPRASQQMLSLLARQTVNDRIPVLLPDGVTVAHKTGELPGLRADVGIVYGPTGSYAIAVFADSANTEQSARVIAEVARRAYDHYYGGAVQ